MSNRWCVDEEVVLEMNVGVPSGTSFLLQRQKWDQRGLHDETQPQITHCCLIRRLSGQGVLVRLPPAIYTSRETRCHTYSRLMYVSVSTNWGSNAAQMTFSPWSIFCGVWMFEIIHEHRLIISPQPIRWRTRIKDSVSLPTAGCTFDDDADPSLCEFSQGEEDDFDWQLYRAHASQYPSSDLLRGKLAIARSYSTGLFHTVSQTISHRVPVQPGCPPTGLISAEAEMTAPNTARSLFVLALVFCL